MALENMDNNTRLIADVRSRAQCYKESLSKYETLLTAHTYLRVFKLTTPLSKYLQTRGLDLLKGRQMVDVTISEIKRYNEILTMLV